LTTAAPPQIPFLVGVTGHRDLDAGQYPALEARVAALLDTLQAAAPTAGLRLLCSLAIGADTLVARLALARGIPVTAILPLAPEEYREDFGDPVSRAEFERLLAAADAIIVAPPVRDESGRIVPSRELAYVAAGEIMAAASRLLVAIWDGHDSAKLGGTAHVVDLRRHPERNGFDKAHEIAGLLGGGDEPIYHLACTRAGEARREPQVPPLEERWIVGDSVQRQPGTQLPAMVRTTLENLEAFARDRLEHAALIEASEPGDLPAAEPADAAGAAIRADFHAADMLGRMYKRRLGRTLVLLYALAIATGVLFMLYGNFELRWTIFVVLGVFASAWYVHRLGMRGAWHRRFLHYRLLAESLRVRYFWHRVGVHRFGAATPHEGFSFELAGGLGWIRNSASCETLRSLAAPAPAPEAGVEVAVQHWIGADGRAGQLGYFAHALGVHQSFDHRTSRITAAGIAGGLACALLLALAVPLGLSERVQNWVLSFMGLLPLIAGVREAYASKQADKEMIKQFGYMRVIFERAGRRLAAAGTLEEQRRVLRELGGISLSETAEWLLVQTERTLDKPKI
jgi:hypothetical protein